MHTSSELPLVSRARAHPNSVALVDAAGGHTYAALLDASARVAAALLGGVGDLAEGRVCFLVPPSFEYAAVQWGVWRAGGIAVPLAVSHPPAELEYAIGDADAAIVVAAPQFAEVLRPLAVAHGARFITTDEALAATPRELPAVDEQRRAMMLYTSGTTGRPKGVVWTHANFRAQVETLTQAWEWRADDRTLLVLPLHHVHGIVNVVGCALWNGATCEVQAKFDANAVWARIESGELTVFMAVPTVYGRLIAAWEAAEPARRERMSAACRDLRLMVSGSAALPVSTLERWREISGHTLLERYGMTEIGMALSNPLHGERRPGSVGVPLPRVEVRLVDEDGSEVEPGTPGEIEVRGPGVFLEYWRRPEATAEAFRDGRWFRTGDVAVVEDDYYRILGRRSVDIIKTGGYKVSALEIEEVLRTHPAVAECAVVAVPDTEWGERVCAAVETRDGSPMTLDDLLPWARERLAPYKLPRALQVVDALPRNAMGKVMKPEVAKRFSGD
ncbi:MAG TPA: acyl-CoA synthetase [Longimicrobium sp.]|nr:acyl-CoA synthetase [Longimicrobium sp.]